MPIQFTVITRENKYLIVSSTQIMGVDGILSLNPSIWAKREVSRIVEALNDRKLEITVHPIELWKTVRDEIRNELDRQRDFYDAKITALTESEKNN